MSTSLSIQSLRAVMNVAAGPRAAEPLPILLGRKLVEARLRRTDQRIARTLEELGHPELIADFNRAKRG